MKLNSQKVAASEVDDNNLLAQVLSVLSFLARYGYYDNPEDMNDILSPLILVLQGFDDIPSPVERLPCSACK